jgi:hypothetical protein
MWERRDVDFIQTQDVPWTFVPDGEFAAGELHRVLSEDPADGARTVILRVRNRLRATLPVRTEILVLEGNGTINGQPLKPNVFITVPPHSPIDLVPGTSRTTLYVAHFGAPRLAEGDGDGDGMQYQDIETLPWAQPEWAGDVELGTGVWVKWLRKDDDGIVYFVAMAPGWRSEPEEVHEQWEESLRLYGDLLQGDRGLMSAGAYSFRSPGVWHAPLYTRGGTASIIRANGATTTEYRDPPPGRRCDDLVAEAYAGVSSPAVDGT